MASDFSLERCDEVLGNVDGTQQGIQQASAKLMFWKRSASDVVRRWEVAFQRADMEKRLVLIYLANDVVQNSRRLGREFIEAFHKALPEAFKHMMKHSDERAQQKLKKLVQVWKDRSVWGTKALGIYTELVKGVSNERPAAAPAVPVAAPQPTLPVPFARLATALTEAHHTMLNVHNLTKANAEAQEALSKARNSGAIPKAELQPMLDRCFQCGSELVVAIQKHLMKQTNAQEEVDSIRAAKVNDIERTKTKLEEAKARQADLQLFQRELDSSSTATMNAEAGQPARGAPPHVASAVPVASGSTPRGSVAATPQAPATGVKRPLPSSSVVETAALTPTAPALPGDANTAAHIQPPQVPNAAPFDASTDPMIKTEPGTASPPKRARRDPRQRAVAAGSAAASAGTLGPNVNAAPAVPLAEAPSAGAQAVPSQTSNVEQVPASAAMHLQLPHRPPVPEQPPLAEQSPMSEVAPAVTLQHPPMHAHPPFPDETQQDVPPPSPAPPNAQPVPEPTPPPLAAVPVPVQPQVPPDLQSGDEHVFRALAGMDPEQVATLLSQMLNKAPENLRTEFGEALYHQALSSGQQ